MMSTTDFQRVQKYINIYIYIFIKNQIKCELIFTLRNAYVNAHGAINLTFFIRVKIFNFNIKMVG